MSTNTPTVGVATKSGLLGALLQFAAAVATYLNDGPTELTLTALGTGAATLLTVLLGRYRQAIVAQHLPRATSVIGHAIRAATSEPLGASLHPPFFDGGPLANTGLFNPDEQPIDEYADPEPGDDDALAHLSAHIAPAAVDHDDSVHA